jgi:hypothetical protein
MNKNIFLLLCGLNLTFINSQTAIGFQPPDENRTNTLKQRHFQNSSEEKDLEANTQQINGSNTQKNAHHIRDAQIYGIMGLTFLASAYYLWTSTSTPMALKAGTYDINDVLFILNKRPSMSESKVVQSLIAMVGIYFLNKAVSEIKLFEPARVLNEATFRPNYLNPLTCYDENTQWPDLAFVVPKSFRRMLFAPASSEMTSCSLNPPLEFKAKVLTGDFSNIRFPIDDLKWFLSLGNLQILTVTGCALTDNMVSTIIDYGRSLRELDISNNPDIYSKTLTKAVILACVPQHFRVFFGFSNLNQITFDGRLDTKAGENIFKYAFPREIALKGCLLNKDVLREGFNCTYTYCTSEISTILTPSTESCGPLTTPISCVHYTNSENEVLLTPTKLYLPEKFSSEMFATFKNYLIAMHQDYKHGLSIIGGELRERNNIDLFMTLGLETEFTTLADRILSQTQPYSIEYHQENGFTMPVRQAINLANNGFLETLQLRIN